MRRRGTAATLARCSPALSCGRWWRHPPYMVSLRPSARVIASTVEIGGNIRAAPLLCRSATSCRSFNSATDHTSSTETNQNNVDLNTFNEVAEEVLLGIQERLEVLEEHDLPEFDMEYADGVLTIRLGDKGTYVLNKQTPNRQIWFSSPLSGPKRFDFMPSTQQWLDARDKKTNLQERLYEEISTLCGVKV
ncbi:ferroxidase [Balamuthia mandrillaris]